MKYRNFYQRFFENYREEKLPDEKGKEKTVRTYTGFFYEAELTAGQKTAVRCLYAGCYLLSLLCFFYAVSRRVPCNSAWYCGLMTGIALVLYLLMAIPMFTYLGKREKMTVYEYRSTSKQLLRFGKWTAFGNAVLAVMMVIATAAAGMETPRQLLPAVLTAAAAALSGAIYALEKRIPYVQLHNPDGEIA